MRRALVPLFAMALAACQGVPPPAGTGLQASPGIDRNYLRDDRGRYLSLHGVNTSGESKVPAWRTVDGVPRPFRQADLLESPLIGVPSFVGRPFPLDAGFKPGDGIAVNPEDPSQALIVGPTIIPNAAQQNRQPAASV